MSYNDDFVDLYEKLLAEGYDVVGDTDAMLSAATRIGLLNEACVRVARERARLNEWLAGQHELAFGEGPVSLMLLRMRKCVTCNGPDIFLDALEATARKEAEISGKWDGPDGRIRYFCAVVKEMST